MGSKTIQWLYWNPNQIVYPAGQDGCLFITTRVTERNIVYKDSDAINDSECNPLLPTKRKCRTTTSSKANIYYIADVEDMTVCIIIRNKFNIILKSIIIIIIIKT